MLECRHLQLLKACLLSVQACAYKSQGCPNTAARLHLKLHGKMSPNSNRNFLTRWPDTVPCRRLRQCVINISTVSNVNNCVYFANMVIRPCRPPSRIVQAPLAQQTQSSCWGCKMTSLLKSAVKIAESPTCRARIVAMLSARVLL